MPNFMAAIRAALYENLEKAVESGSKFAIRNLVQAFQQHFPNPHEEVPDKMTFFRSLANTFSSGMDEIELFAPLQKRLIRSALPDFGYKLFGKENDKLLLLGSRPLLSWLKVEEKAKLDELQKTASSVQLPGGSTLDVLEEVNKILGVSSRGSFNITLWDILHQGLWKKLDKNSTTPVNALKITIQSMQELSELFDANGRPRRIIGLPFLISQKEIDAYLQRIYPYLREFGIVEGDHAITIELKRTPLYDHSTVNPKTGEDMSLAECESFMQVFVQEYESSDLTYVHCYAGKQRSPWMVGLLAIYENIKACKILIELPAQARDKQITLNDLFQTPYEIFDNIRAQRKEAKSLFSMKPQQQQIIYEFFFKRIEELPDKHCKNVLFTAFVAKSPKIIANNLQIYVQCLLDQGGEVIALTVGSGIVKSLLHKLQFDPKKYNDVIKQLSPGAKDQLDAVLEAK